MPRFAVTIEGTNIKIRYNGEDVIGFFTTRYVSASDTNSASALALKILNEEWTLTSNDEFYSSSRPSLRVDTIHELSWIWCLWKRGTGGGFTFY